jgi:hypothetical protein
MAPKKKAAAKAAATAPAEQDYAVQPAAKAAAAPPPVQPAPEQVHPPPAPIASSIDLDFQRCSECGRRPGAGKTRKKVLVVNEPEQVDLGSGRISKAELIYFIYKRFKLPVKADENIDALDLKRLAARFMHCWKALEGVDLPPMPDYDDTQEKIDMANEKIKKKNKKTKQACEVCRSLPEPVDANAADGDENDDDKGSHDNDNDDDDEGSHDNDNDDDDEGSHHDSASSSGDN